MNAKYRGWFQIISVILLSMALANANSLKEVLRNGIYLIALILLNNDNNKI